MSSLPIFLIALLCTVSAAWAGPITYDVTVETSSISSTAGSLDFNFNPGPLVTQSAFLQILGFSSDGTLASSPTLTGDVAGALPAALTFDNGTGFNDYFEGFTFGSTLSFEVSLYGPALSSPDGVSTSGSTFAFSMFSDAAGTVPALTSDTTDGFAFTVGVNLDGSTTVTNSSSQTSVAPLASVVPEASSFVLLVTALAAWGIYRAGSAAKAKGRWTTKRKQQDMPRDMISVHIPDQSLASPRKEHLVARPHLRDALILFLCCLPVKSVTAAQTPSCTPPPSGLVSWWPLDGSGADIKDGNSGTVLGGRFVPAEVGSGFNSSNGIVSVPSAPNLNVSQFTFETWLRADNIAPPNMVIVWKGETGGGFDLTSPYFIEVSGQAGGGPNVQNFGTAGPGKILVDLTDGVHDQGYFSNSALSVGTFHHMAVTVDGQTVRIYIDGQLDAAYPQMVTPFTSGSNPFQIGGISDLSTNYFQGVIDELSLYNRALTSNEIQAIFNAGTAGKFKGEITFPRSNPSGSFPYPPQYEVASFKSTSGTLSEYAGTCRFDGGFNWQQIITHDPPTPGGSPITPNDPGPLILSGNVAYLGTIVPALDPLGVCLSSVLWAGCSLTAGPSYFDPPSGGYTYENSDPYPNPYPFSIPTQLVYPGSRACNVGNLCPIFPYAESDDGTILSFVDDPADNNLSGETPSSSPSGNFIAFQTTLVGISSQGSTGCDPSVSGPPYCTNLFWWTWNSTFKGTAGGVHQTASIYAIDPGSGTGGVTITSINGVQLPPVVPANQVATTASGLAYSRVSQTFNGTVTIRNISSSAISGPLQVVCFGMTSGVTLVSATGNLSGTPYLTVPNVTSLASGQSVTISVQFKNPSNATINFTPVIYSGSIN